MYRLQLQKDIECEGSEKQLPYLVPKRQPGLDVGMWTRALFSRSSNSIVRARIVEQPSCARKVQPSRPFILEEVKRTSRKFCLSKSKSSPDEVFICVRSGREHYVGRKISVVLSDMKLPSPYK